MNRQITARDNFDIPSWAWFFILASGAVVLFAGANVLSTVQILVGFCGAIACAWIAQDSDKSTSQRMVLCIAVTTVCWLIYTSLAISIAAFYVGHAPEILGMSFGYHQVMSLGNWIPILVCPNGPKVIWRYCPVCPLLAELTVLNVVLR